MRIQVLFTPGCANGPRALALATEVAAALAPGAEVEAVTVATLAEAAGWGFPGSPTILVDGRDVEPDPPADPGLG